MNILAVVPEKRGDLREILDEEGLHITRDKTRGASPAMRFLIWARQTPRYHRVDLDDPVGRTVWGLIDGERSVGDIVSEVVSRHATQGSPLPYDREETTRLTVRFLRMLYAARLIRYRT